MTELCEGSGRAVSVITGNANGNTIGWPIALPVCPVCGQGVAWTNYLRLEEHTRLRKETA